MRDNYILCYCSENTISPQGDGKSFEYASSLLTEYQEKVPDQNWKMFKLVEVDMKEEKELKNCPWCDSKAIIHFDELDHHYFIRCSSDECYARCGFSKKDEAIKAWNTRPLQQKEWNEWKDKKIKKFNNSRTN